MYFKIGIVATTVQSVAKKRLLEIANTVLPVAMSDLSDHYAPAGIGQLGYC